MADTRTTMHKLRTLRAAFEGMEFWAGMLPAIDHALALAAEAEYVARNASNLAQYGIEPVYPPLVQLLADAAPPDRADSLEAGR